MNNEFSAQDIALPLKGGMVESRFLYVRTKGKIAKTKLLSGEKGGLFASANGG